MEQPKNEKLWKIAKKRAAFKRHLFAYIAVNGFLWCLWWINRKEDAHVWPLYPMLGWGIGLAFNYYDAYQGDNDSLAEKEYERLEKEQSNKHRG